MASNKWQEPTMGWLAATPDPTQVQALVQYVQRQQELNIARQLYAAAFGKKSNQLKWNGSGFTNDATITYPNLKGREPTESELLSFYNKVREAFTPIEGNATPESLAAKQAEQAKFRSLFNGNAKNIGIYDPKTRSYKTAFNIDTLAPQLTATFDPTKFDWNGGYEGTLNERVTPGFGYSIGKARTPFAQPSLLEQVSGKQTPARTSIWGPSANDPLNNGMNSIVGQYMQQKAQQDALEKSWTVRRFYNQRKGSFNDYYEINPQVAKKLGLSTTSLYDPSIYENPKLFRFFDSPSYSARNAGRYIYNDEANKWGGMSYADEAAIAIFKKYGLSPEELAQRYGTFNGMSASDRAGLYQIDLGNGKTGYYIPYDFAIHGLTGANKTNYMPAKSFQWYTENATPVHLGNEYVLPEFTGSNPYKLKSSTGNIGFLTLKNPFEHDEEDFKRFQKELKLGGMGGEATRFKDGLYMGNSLVRQSYDDGGGFLRKAIGAIVSFAGPLVLGPALGNALGSVAGKALAGAISGAVGSGIAGGDIGKGVLTGGISGAVGGLAGDYARGWAESQKLGEATVNFASKVGSGLGSMAVNKLMAGDAPSSLEFSAPEFAASGAVGNSPPNGATSAANPTAPAKQTSFSNNVSNDNPAQQTYTNDPNYDYSRRSRRWGGAWGNTIVA
jgi:hypothetical protein